MLEKLFRLGYFNYNRYVIENITSLNLSIEEAFVFIKILDYYLVDGKIHTSELSNDCNTTKQKIQIILSSLMEKSMYEIYLSYNNGVGEEYISLKPFFNKIEGNVSGDNKQESNANIIPDVIAYLEEEFQRVLTASELEIITSIVNEDNYSLDQVKAAVMLCKKKRRAVSIKNITMMFAYVDNPSLTNERVNEAKDEDTKALKKIYNMMGKK